MIYSVPTNGIIDRGKTTHVSGMMSSKPFIVGSDGAITPTGSWCRFQIVVPIDGAVDGFVNDKYGPRPITKQEAAQVVRNMSRVEWAR